LSHDLMSFLRELSHPEPGLTRRSLAKYLPNGLAISPVRTLTTHPPRICVLLFSLLQSFWRSTKKNILRSEKVDRTMQPFAVVVFNKRRNQSSRILQVNKARTPQAFLAGCSVHSLDLPVALRIGD